MPNYTRKIQNVTTGQTFPSIRDASRMLGINCGSLTHSLRKGQKYKGQLWQYLDQPKPKPEPDETSEASQEVMVLEALKDGPLSLSQIAEKTGLDSKLALMALNRQKGICVQKIANDQGIFWALQLPPNREDDPIATDTRKVVPVDYPGQLARYTARRLGAVDVMSLGDELIGIYAATDLEDVEVGRYIRIRKSRELNPNTYKTTQVTSLSRENGFIYVTTRSVGKKRFPIYPGELEAVGRPVPVSLDLGEELREALELIRCHTYKAKLSRAKQAAILTTNGIPESLVWLLEAFWSSYAQDDLNALTRWIAKQKDWESKNYPQRHRLATGHFLNLRPCLPIVYHPNFPGLL